MGESTIFICGNLRSGKSRENGFLTKTDSRVMSTNDSAPMLLPYFEVTKTFFSTGKRLKENSIIRSPSVTEILLLGKCLTLISCTPSNVSMITGAIEVNKNV